jgi:hypothetical protein
VLLARHARVETGVRKSRSPRDGTIGRPGAPHTGYPEPGTCVLRSSSCRRRLTDASLGRANRSSGFYPPTAWPGHWVRQRGCYGSDRVADRPSALHAEAPDRHGRGTRLAPDCSSRREPSRIDERLSPCCVGALPGISARTRRNGVAETRGLNPSLHGAWSEYRNRRRRRKCRYLFGLAHCDVHRLWMLKHALGRRSATHPHDVDL